MNILYGTIFEDLAVIYLKKNKIKILERNFRCKLGEIDIIAQDTSNLIFAEVRFRKNDLYGGAAESVTVTKQLKIIRAAKIYLQTICVKSELNYRFDVIAISRSIESPQIEWIKDAFNE